MPTTKPSAPSADKQQDPRLGKDFLVSWMLLLLRNLNTYGYQLIQTMTAMGLGAVDPTTVYRTLRKLEDEGLISSTWNPMASGPARRMYSITEAGQNYLNQWASGLEQYQSLLTRFFDIYSNDDSIQTKTTETEK